MTKCCKKKKSTNMWEGILYGLIPHIGCIGFIIGSVLGVTILMQFFRPLLMNRYFFHFLILISLGFATLASLLYLRKHKKLSQKGVKSEWKYLLGMYGSTIGINLVLFMLIFPLLANVSVASNDEGTSDSTLSLSVDIPCPGHAPLISNDLKTLSGVTDVKFSFPNNFKVSYDSTKVSKEQMLDLDVFQEYLAKVISEEVVFQESIVGASCSVGSCGSTSCTGGCGGCGSY